MSCCGSNEEPEYKYEVKTVVLNEHGKQESYRYVNSLEQVDHNTKNDEHVSITKVKTQLGLSTLQEQMTKQNKQFVDETFPPNQSSLGQIQGNIGWRRVPEILKNVTPVLFDRKIQPSDVIAGHVGDCYLLSALAALAEFPDIIKKIFRGQKENSQGIYKVNLRVDGVVEQVVIDDNIPVQENGLPIFCQPNRKTGEMWVVLLEKALAKINGSYANLNEGSPSQIFRAVTYAPSESLTFSSQSSQKDKIWNLLYEYTHNHYPFCATTKEQISSDRGLQKLHTYTVIAAEELHSGSKNYRVIKLRNPWKSVDYKGQGPTNNPQFWNHIDESTAKHQIMSIKNNCDYGLFYILFEDFCHSFDQVHYCNLNDGGKFVSEKLLLGNKASFYDLNVQKEDVFTFELNQSKIVGQTEAQKQEEGACRSTIILVKKQKDGTHETTCSFVNGIMIYNETNTMLTEKLSPGQYVIYAKIDTTFLTHKYPSSAVINIYSKAFPELTAVQRTKYPNLIRSALENHAIRNKKLMYCDDKIWVSWQLFFQKGGFAYLAAGNSKDSEHSIVINFNEDDFKQLGFKLKKPLKGKGSGQVIRIPPGSQEIIVARVINDPTVKTIKFPPKLDIKLQPLYR